MSCAAVCCQPPPPPPPSGCRPSRRAAEGRPHGVRWQETDDGASRNLISALSSLAHILRMAGSYSEAEALLWRVQGLIKQEHGSRSPQAAQVLLRMGDTARLQGKYAPAAKHYRQALAGEAAPATRAAAHSGLAGALAGQADWRGAADALRAALAEVEPLAGRGESLAVASCGALWARLEGALRAADDAIGANEAAARAAAAATEVRLHWYMLALVPAARMRRMRDNRNTSTAARAETCRRLPLLDTGAGAFRSALIIITALELGLNAACQDLRYRCAIALSTLDLSLAGCY